jgi:hypothetical protein
VGVAQLYVWSIATLLGATLAVPALRLVQDRAEMKRATVAEARAKAQADLRRAKREHERLLAERERVLRLQQKAEDVVKRRHETWLCERVRCNEADFIPVTDSVLVPDDARSPLDDWAMRPRRRR